MADQVLEELNERFGSGGKDLEPDVVAELKSIMRMHQLSPQDLFFKWESYCIKMDMAELKASVQVLRNFKQDLQDALERSNRTQVHIKQEKRSGATPRVGKGGDVFGMLDGLTSTPNARASKMAPRKTPATNRIKAEPASSPLGLEGRFNAMGVVPPSSFNDRPNPGDTVEVLNEHLQPAEPPISPFPESRIKLTAGSDQKKLGYKPLAMKLSEASEILDDRIEEFLRLVMEHHEPDEPDTPDELGQSPFGDPASQSTSDIIAVGRIASDSLEGKLNAASLVLETSRRTGGGLRVPLNIKQLPGYQFFPGQIVALKGTNSSGREFAVKQVLELPLLPSAASTTEALQTHLDRLRGGPDAMDSDDSPTLPLNVIFASGPYTADDNLDFEPLKAICNEAADTYVDALVLTGPFIDIEHPLIASGDFDLPEEAANQDPDTANMSTVFKYLISPQIHRLVSANPTITILLIPSVRDVLSKHVSWPQDVFPRRELGLPKSVKVIGNPMTFAMNEMLVGISSQDVLFELRSEELVGGPRLKDKELLSRACKYLIEQRHFFPLFPPTDRTRLPKTGAGKGIPPGAMLDVGYLKLGEMVNVRPDVLVVPSSLPPFAKVIESVLVINPGYLSKRKGAGTYAKMTLYPPDLSQQNGDGMLAHKIFERARVEITKI